MDKSLLLAAEAGSGTRYHLLETICEYAGEAAAAAGETELLAQLHCDYYLALAEQAEPQLQSSEQVVWLNRLSAEYDNFRAALSWAVGRGAAILLGHCRDNRLGRADHYYRAPAY